MKFKEFLESPISKFRIFDGVEFPLVIYYHNENNETISKTVIVKNNEIHLFDEFEIIDIKIDLGGIINGRRIIIIVKEEVEDETIQEEENGETGTEQESEGGDSDIQHEGDLGESETEETNRENNSGNVSESSNNA